MVQTVSCHQPSVGALQRPAGRGRRNLKPVQSFFRRTTSPTRILPPHGHVSRLGRFEASELRGFLPGREGSTSKRREAHQQGPVKGAELEWASSLNDKYRLGKVLGTGAFGTVRMARSRQNGELVAIKVLSKSRPGQSRERTVTKLRREAECMVAVQECDGVVRLKGLFEDATSAYFVLEQCSGGDLEQLIADGGPLEEHQVAVLLFEILRVVAACHRRGICHGDVKPANFLMTKRLSKPIRSLRPGERVLETGWLKAIDFGCAQQIIGDKPLTRRTGTPVYMAPEVFVRRYSRPADMWSVGMLMFHLLSARFPFWDNMQQCHASRVEEVAEAITSKPINTNCAPFTNLSREGMNLLTRLLVRDSSKRLTAQQALNHPYFKMHLGWHAEAPRLIQDVLPNLVTAWAEGRPGLAPNSVLPDSFPQTPAAKPAPAVKAAPAPQPPVAKPVAPPVEVPVAVAVASHEGASTPEQRAVSPEPVVANNVVPCGSSHQGAGGCTVASKRSPAQKAGEKSRKGSSPTKVVARRANHPSQGDRQQRQKQDLAPAYSA